MSGHDSAPEVLVWCDALHSEAVGRVVELMGSAIHPIGLGGPRSADLTELSNRLECVAENDLRKLIVEKPSGFVLIASLDDVTPDIVNLALSGGTHLISLEPLADSFEQIPDDPSHRGRADSIVSFTACPGWRSAADPAQALGVIQSIAFTSYGGAESLTLYARLYDAWQAASQFTDIPETIDASLRGPLSEPPDQLRGLTGNLSLHARINENTAAVMQLSDHAAMSHRHLHVLGDEGELSVTETGYDLLRPNGDIIDRQDPREAVPALVELCVDQWRQLIDLGIARSPRSGHDVDCDRRVLACCLASLLSCRTGDPESPQRVLEMARGI